jgi:hypothetical protein
VIASGTTRSKRERERSVRILLSPLPKLCRETHPSRIDWRGLDNIVSVSIAKVAKRKKKAVCLCYRSGRHEPTLLLVLTRAVGPSILEPAMGCFVSRPPRSGRTGGARQQGMMSWDPSTIIQTIRRPKRPRSVRRSCKKGKKWKIDHYSPKRKKKLTYLALFVRRYVTVFWHHDETKRSTATQVAPRPSPVYRA